MKSLFKKFIDFILSRPKTAPFRARINCGRSSISLQKTANFSPRSFIFAKLFQINDSAQKIALGVGLGVFSGLIPGTGPVAALFLAFVFRANRAAALLGSIFTNTWLSLVTFILAIKVGSVILKVNWQVVQQQAQGLVKNFSWAGFFKLSFLEVLLPMIIGYLAIGLVLGVLSYSLVLFIIRRNLHGDKTA